jgi:hypothetical protein
MKIKVFAGLGGLGLALAVPAASFAALYGDTPDAKHAWSVHDRNRPNPVKVSA